MKLTTTTTTTTTTKTNYTTRNRSNKRPISHSAFRLANMQTPTVNLNYLYLTALVLANIIALVSTYNLDAQKALLKRGNKDSYFGYSIAQHATFEPQSSNSTFKSYVIVGAPRDSSRAATLSGVTRPGAVYRCDFSLARSCQLIDIDSSLDNSIQTYHMNDLASSTSNNPSSNEAPPTGQLLASAMDPVVQRDDQWLGVSVKSQGPNGYALACAHRYVLKGFNYRWAQGICYSLTQNLTYHKPWQPCLNRPVNKAHEEYGFCQVGTSSDISDSSDVLLGAPGVYTWRGTVFSNSISSTAKDDRTWYMAPVQDEESKVDRYSYLGMSLISGRFFDKQQYYVSGAPRAKEVGQVLFMTKNYLDGSKRAETNFRTDQILQGEQLGSAFGYSLIKMDFNGDSLLDLVVSAPFYFSKSEGGAVYAYANEGKSVVLSSRLTGKPESRFGFAIANCGDLNRDKYEDLAIGAPYESQGGTVYIHLGSSAGLKQSPSQVIKASSVANQLQTFGYSLSGGLDMDRNGYPDLAVGSYADDAVFIIRGRPIIDIVTKIEGNLTRIDPNRTTCDGERSQLPCFKFNTCFELDPATLGEYTDSMKLKYRIEAETFTGQRYSRVKFQESENSETPHILERDILIQDYYKGLKLKRCHPQRVYIKDRSDIQTPIQFKLTYSLVEPADTTANNNALSSSSSSSLISSSRYSSLSPINSLISSTFSSSSTSSAAAAGGSSSEPIPAPFPILNQEEAQRVFSARFLKDCGSNDICESHLDVDGQLQLPKETLGIHEPGYTFDKQANVTIRVANANEPAYEAKLFVTHPTNLIYSGFKTQRQASIVECTSVEKNLIKCDLGNPMPKGTTKMMMIFNTQNQAGTFDFNLMVNTTSQNSKDAKTSYDLSGTIRKKAELPTPTRPPVVYPEPAMQEPPAWLILVSILLGILLFSGLFYCLYVHGFFDRPKTRYTQAHTEERFN